MAAGQIQLTRRRPWSERIIEALLFVAAALGVVTTIGIVVILVVPDAASSSRSSTRSTS